jgi:hypothetical protein
MHEARPPHPPNGTTLFELKGAIVREGPSRAQSEIKQSPSTQWFLPWQTLPQPPQFASSLLVSTHAPEQREYPELQVVPHTPREHTGLPFVTAGHALLQPPQLFGSVLVSTH